MVNGIEINPKIMLGKPVIKGTRIPVYLIVELVAQGLTYEEILQDYPHLTKRDIQNALEYAGNVIKNEEVFPLAK